MLNLVAAGRSNAEIGRSLHLAESSVTSHVGHLLGKLGLADRVHLVIFAYDNGLAWKEPAPALNRENTVPVDQGRHRRMAFPIPGGGTIRDSNQAGAAAVRIGSPNRIQSTG